MSHSRNADKRHAPVRSGGRCPDLCVATMPTSHPSCRDVCSQHGYTSDSRWERVAGLLAEVVSA